MKGKTKTTSFFQAKIILLWAAILLSIFFLYRLISSHESPTGSENIRKTPFAASNQPVIDSILKPNQAIEQKSLTSSQFPDWGLVPKNKYAYVTLLHGIDESLSYRGFLFNCILMKTSLERLGSSADFLALVGFTFGSQPSHPTIMADLALLRSHGIQIVFLPRLFPEQYITQMKKDKVQFHEMALLKVLPWSFTQYEKVQYMDGDVLPHTNMDCLFHLPSNTFNTGSASPLNSGWYLAIPNEVDYRILRAKAEWRLMLNRWDDSRGWGTPIPADHKLKYRGLSRPVKKWEFNGASLDQGLLTHYFVLNQGRAVLLDEESALAFAANFTFTTSRVSQVLQCCKGKGPMEMFFHYTGQNKPWLKDLKQPKDMPLKYWVKVLDEAKLDLNSSNIDPKKFRPALGFFYPNK
ncbi:hypothetical protein EON65_38390 [archaeon]|nr:MAG: hypothetical protein EON65_38390 [archaeon]